MLRASTSRPGTRLFAEITQMRALGYALRSSRTITFRGDCLSPFNVTAEQHPSIALHNIHVSSRGLGHLPTLKAPSELKVACQGLTWMQWSCRGCYTRFQRLHSMQS